MPCACLCLRDAEPREAGGDVTLSPVAERHAQNVLQLAEKFLCRQLRRVQDGYAPACASASLYSLFATTISSCSSSRRVACSQLSRYLHKWVTHASTAVVLAREHSDERLDVLGAADDVAHKLLDRGCS